MPFPAKLTDDQREEIRQRKAYHSQLIKQGEWAKARQVGPKVIAYDYGIDKSMVYRIANEESKQ